MFDHCICSCRVGLHRVHNFFTIRVRINQRHDQKRATHHVFPQNISKNGVHAAFRPKTAVPERNAKACEVIDEVSRSSFTPEVHTSTALPGSRAAAKPPGAPEGRAGRRGEHLHAAAERAAAPPRAHLLAQLLGSR